MTYQEIEAQFDSLSIYEEWEAFHGSLPEAERNAWDAHAIVLIHPLRTRWHALKMESKNEAFERLKELFNAEP